MSSKKRIFDLSEKEPKVLTCALDIFSEAPLEKGGTMRHALSAKKRKLIDKLIKRINNDFYNSTSQELNILPREEIIKKRLNQKFKHSLKPIEVVLVKEALQFYIKYSLLGNNRNCLSSYHGGAEYQIDLDDFVALYHRLFPENSKDELD